MARSKAEDIPTDAMFNPEKYGYEECSHCKGFGSSLKDPEGVDTCTVCGGPGLVFNLKLTKQETEAFEKLIKERLQIEGCHGA